MTTRSGRRGRPSRADKAAQNKEAGGSNVAPEAQVEEPKENLPNGRPTALGATEAAALKTYMNQKEYRKKRNQDPAVKEKQREYHRQRTAKQKQALTAAKALADEGGITLDELLAQSTS